MGKEPQGCLTAILGLLGFRIGGETGGDDEAKLPYLLRNDFLSSAERSFYGVLRLAIGERGVICPKVNLADIVFVPRSGETQGYRNKIDRKHVDFLVCNPQTMKPLFGVELDDKSHERADRKERDRFVDRVFQAAGLPLVHQPARAAYDPQALATELGDYFGERVARMPAPSAPATTVVTATEAATSPGATTAPTCAKCGVPMVERTASKGPNAGKAFWGCSNFPRCCEIA